MRACRRRRRLVIALGITIAVAASHALPGCGGRFTFTEEVAMERLMASKHVAGLRRAIPSRQLTCRVDGAMPEAIHLYLGDDMGDHTARVGFYRVTRDGRLWLNQDITGLEDRWAVIE